MGMLGINELETYQAEVLDMLFERTATAEAIDIFRFAPSGLAGGHVVPGEPFGKGGQHMTLYLLNRSTNVFIAVTDKKSVAVAPMIAKLKKCERERGQPLALGEAIVTAEESPHAEAPYAVLLARGATLADLADMPDTATISGRTTAFFFAVPLTRAEYDFRVEQGLEALLSRFEAEGKRLAF
jgi:hypothetical protein